MYSVKHAHKHGFSVASTHHHTHTHPHIGPSFLPSPPPQNHTHTHKPVPPPPTSTPHTHTHKHPTITKGGAYADCDSTQGALEILDQSLQDASPQTPIYFILSPGANVVGTCVWGGIVYVPISRSVYRCGGICICIYGCVYNKRMSTPSFILAPGANVIVGA